VGREKFREFAMERHGWLKYYSLAFMHYLGLALAFTPRLFNYFGSKGYTRLMPYFREEAVRMLEPHFVLRGIDSDYYHWFFAERRDDT
jgi:hypothetical protein